MTRSSRRWQKPHCTKSSTMVSQEPISSPIIPMSRLSCRHDIQRCRHRASLHLFSTLPYTSHILSYILLAEYFPFYAQNVTPRIGRVSYGSPNSQQRPISSNHNSIQSRGSSRDKTKVPDSYSFFRTSHKATTQQRKTQLFTP